jgi:tRNA threonylcarbamoyladenosine biosynthesis protein TsaB
MSLLLHIDTAVEKGSVCISKNGKPLIVAENNNQKDLATWIQPAIQSLVKEAGLRLQEFHAVAVSNGPGSYTGLRVGLATAKGLCYALNIPLITLSTLEIMVAAITANQQTALGSDLFCPMIDARRMEVFTGLYDKNLNAILPPHAKVIDETAFKDELDLNTILFFGNGAAKCKPVINHPHSFFTTVEYNALHMIGLAGKKMEAKDFAGLAGAEPFYIKDFHTIPSKQ